MYQKRSEGRRGTTLRGERVRHGTAWTILLGDGFFEALLFVGLLLVGLCLRRYCFIRRFDSERAAAMARRFARSMWEWGLLRTDCKKN